MKEIIDRETGAIIFKSTEKNTPENEIKLLKKEVTGLKKELSSMREEISTLKKLLNK